MKIYITLFMITVLNTTSSSAIDIKMGKGSFEWILKAGAFYNSYNTLDVYIFGMSEHHLNFDNSRFYRFGNLDIYSSTKQANSREKNNQFIFDLLGINGNSSSTTKNTNGFKVDGLDLNMGVGYDVLKFSKGFVGLGLVTGVSLPFLNADNPLRVFATDSDSTVYTYKFGTSFQGEFNFTKNLSLYSTLLYGYQTGNIKNKRDKIIINGDYVFLDIGVKIINLLDSKLSASLGFNTKHWTMDEIDVTLSNVNVSFLSSLLSNNLSSDYFYFGLGYEF